MVNKDEAAAYKVAFIGDSITGSIFPQLMNLGEKTPYIATDTLISMDQINPLLDENSEQPPINAVVIDPDFGEFQGPQIIERMRRIRRYDKTAIVVYSQYDREDIKERCVMAGADEYILKSAEPIYLKDTVVNTIRRRSEQ
jgi:DNA-binding response OmpR family regulator